MTLKEHLSSDTVGTYETIKSTIADGIKKAMKSPATTVCERDVPKLVYRLGAGLDEISATRVLEGSCQICNKIDNLAARDSRITDAEPADEKEQPPDQAAFNNQATLCVSARTWV